jgi:hypothetical protein
VYGRNTEPNYAFVPASLRTDPHRQLVDELQRQFEVTDDTDSNDDVSFNYLLRKDRKTWRLALSMVGPFALLVRATEPQQTTVVTQETGDTDEARILDAVRARGFTFLDRDTIRKTLDVKYHGGRQDDWTVYQALISSSEMLPG